MDQILCTEPGLQERVREVHPEVCFWAWNGDKVMPFNKKNARGCADRRALVDAYFGPLAFKTV